MHRWSEVSRQQHSRAQAGGYAGRKGLLQAGGAPRPASLVTVASEPLRRRSLHCPPLAEQQSCQHPRRGGRNQSFCSVCEPEGSSPPAHPPCSARDPRLFPLASSSQCCCVCGPPNFKFPANSASPNPLTESTLISPAFRAQRSGWIANTPSLRQLKPDKTRA